MFLACFQAYTQRGVIFKKQQRLDEAQRAFEAGARLVAYTGCSWRSKFTGIVCNGLGAKLGHPYAKLQCVE